MVIYKHIQHLIKYFAVAGLCVAVFFVFFFQKNTAVVERAAAQAGVRELSGWAWDGDGSPSPGGTGWISFNSYDCDTNKNGTMDAGDTGSPNCPSVGTAMPRYVVTVDQNDSNKLKGEAWSSSIGYIKFNPGAGTDGYPQDPMGDAKIDSSNNVIGWARACTVFVNSDCSNGTLRPLSERGGWDGWIKLSSAPMGSPSYGVDFSMGDYTGFAWGGDVMGWIKFCDRGLGARSFCVSENFDFNLSNSGNVTVTKGDPAQNTITATLASGSPEEVSFTIQADPVIAENPQISPSAFSPVDPRCTPQCSWVLNINTADSSVYAGDYTVTITGRSRFVQKTTSFTLTVVQGCGFTLGDPSIPVQSVEQDDPTAPNTFTAYSLGGSSPTVTFSVPVSSVPSGASIISFPSSCDATCSRSLRIDTSNSTPIGTYSIQVDANSAGCPTQSKWFTLNVTPPTSGGTFELNHKPYAEKEQCVNVLNKGCENDSSFCSPGPAPCIRHPHFIRDIAIPPTPSTNTILTIDNPDNTFCPGNVCVQPIRVWIENVQKDDNGNGIGDKDDGYNSNGDRDSNGLYINRLSYRFGGVFGNSYIFNPVGGSYSGVRFNVFNINLPNGRYIIAIHADDPAGSNIKTFLILVIGESTSGYREL